MFARMLEFEVKPENKEEFVKKVENEVLPILRKQGGFLVVVWTCRKKLEFEHGRHGLSAVIVAQPEPQPLG
jgi:hypothetical protein